MKKIVETKEDESSKKDPDENSDVEIFSAPDEANKEQEEKKKRRKRRRREIDKIKMDDDDDGSDESGDEISSKRSKDMNSSGPNSPSHTGTREPRSCVLNQRQKRRPLSRLLEQLLKNLEKKDHNQFFAWPVDDSYAPNYSKIIKKPMDFSTMKQKIDDNEYKTFNCFINDFKLMCNNAMKYNKSGTVYHKAAKKLLHVGLRQMEPEKLRPLGHILTYMYEIPMRELGFDMGKMDAKAIRQRRVSAGTGDDERSELSQELAKMRKIEKARADHRRKLAKKAFPRMDNKGFTSLQILVDNDGMIPSTNQRPISLGLYTGRISHGTGTLQGFKEDRRNLVKGVKALNYGAFGSYAPSYDSTFATISKEESHLLYHCYADELGLNTGESNLRFAQDSPWNVIYDMETLFPKPPDKAETATSADNKEVKINIENLKGLSELGIDVDFLADLEDDIVAAQQDFGLQNSLNNNASMLKKLETEQRERLSQAIPPHLSMVPKPSLSEQEVARAVVANLRDMISKVQPQHIVPVTSIRKAMGVSLHHLKTPTVSADELSTQGNENRINETIIEEKLSELQNNDNTIQIEDDQDITIIEASQEPESAKTVECENIVKKDVQIENMDVEQKINNTNEKSETITENIITDKEIVEVVKETVEVVNEKMDIVEPLDDITESKEDEVKNIKQKDDIILEDTFEVVEKTEPISTITPVEESTPNIVEKVESPKNIANDAITTQEKVDDITETIEEIAENKDANNSTKITETVEEENESVETDAALKIETEKVIATVENVEKVENDTNSAAAEIENDKPMAVETIPVVSEEPMLTESEDSVETKTAEHVVTETEEPMVTESEVPVVTKNEEPVSIESKEPVTIESDEPVTTESDEPEPTESEKPVTENEEPVVTECKDSEATEIEDSTIESETPIAKTSESSIPAEADEAKVTENEDPLSVVEDPIMTENEIPEPKTNSPIVSESSTIVENVETSSEAEPIQENKDSIIDTTSNENDATENNDNDE